MTVAVGLQDRPADAPSPSEGHWESDYRLTNSPTFVDGISAISSHIFAFSGTPAFFQIAAEMREPRHYTRSLLTCQSIVTVTYITIGIVVYYYCGSYVASPALGSAGVLMKKVCYGFALPGLIVTAMLMTHVSDGGLSYVQMLIGLMHRSRPSISLFDSSVAQSTSTPTVRCIGAPGWHVLEESPSLRTSSRAASPCLGGLFR